MDPGSLYISQSVINTSNGCWLGAWKHVRGLGVGIGNHSFTKGLSCSRHCIKHCTCVISFNPSQSCHEGLPLPSLHRRGSCRSSCQVTSQSWEMAYPEFLLTRHFQPLFCSSALECCLSRVQSMAQTLVSHREKHLHLWLGLDTDLQP